MDEMPVIIEPARPATACVIWLHGLGADGHDFEPVVPYLGATVTGHTRFVFPHAPMRPVTVNGGVVMRAWYDILEMRIERRVDESGVRAAEAQLQGLLEEQRKLGLTADRVVLAGFSQGGAIALYTALRLPETVAGVLALSTYLPLADRAHAESTAAGRASPVFMGHGSQDPVVPVDLARRSLQMLESLGVDVQWHRYQMEHSLCAEELADIADWLAARLPPG